MELPAIWMIFQTFIIHFLSKGSKHYPSELKLIKTNNLDTVTSYLDLHISILNNALNTKIYEKRGDLILI